MHVLIISIAVIILAAYLSLWIIPDEHPEHEHVATEDGHQHPPSKVEVKTIRKMDAEREALRVVRLPYDTDDNLAAQYEAGLLDSIDYALRSDRTGT